MSEAPKPVKLVISTPLVTNGPVETRQTNTVDLTDPVFGDSFAQHTPMEMFEDSIIDQEELAIINKAFEEANIEMPENWWEGNTISYAIGEDTPIEVAIQETQDIQEAGAVDESEAAQKAQEPHPLEDIGSISLAQRQEILSTLFSKEEWRSLNTPYEIDPSDEFMKMVRVDGEGNFSIDLSGARPSELAYPWNVMDNLYNGNNNSNTSKKEMYPDWYMTNAHYGEVGTQWEKFIDGPLQGSLEDSKIIHITEPDADGKVTVGNGKNDETIDFQDVSKDADGNYSGMTDDDPPKYAQITRKDDGTVVINRYDTDDVQDGALIDGAKATTSTVHNLDGSTISTKIDGENTIETRTSKDGQFTQVTNDAGGNPVQVSVYGDSYKLDATDGLWHRLDTDGNDMSDMVLAKAPTIEDGNITISIGEGDSKYTRTYAPDGSLAEVIVDGKTYDMTGYVPNKYWPGCLNYDKTTSEDGNMDRINLLEDGSVETRQLINGQWCGEKYDPQGKLISIDPVGGDSEWVEVQYDEESEAFEGIIDEQKYKFTKGEDGHYTSEATGETIAEPSEPSDATPTEPAESEQEGGLTLEFEHTERSTHVNIGDVDSIEFSRLIKPDGNGVYKGTIVNQDGTYQYAVVSPQKDGDVTVQYFDYDSYANSGTLEHTATTTYNKDGSFIVEEFGDNGESTTKKYDEKGILKEQKIIDSDGNHVVKTFGENSDSCEEKYVNGKLVEKTTIATNGYTVVQMFDETGALREKIEADSLGNKVYTSYYNYADGEEQKSVTLEKTYSPSGSLTKLSFAGVEYNLDEYTLNDTGSSIELIGKNNSKTITLLPKEGIVETSEQIDGQRCGERRDAEGRLLQVDLMGENDEWQDVAVEDGQYYILDNGTRKIIDQNENGHFAIREESVPIVEAIIETADVTGNQDTAVAVDRTATSYEDISSVEPEIGINVTIEGNMLMLSNGIGLEFVSDIEVEGNTYKGYVSRTTLHKNDNGDRVEGKITQYAIVTKNPDTGSTSVSYYDNEEAYTAGQASSSTQYNSDGSKIHEVKLGSNANVKNFISPSGAMTQIIYNGETPTRISVGDEIYGIYAGNWYMVNSSGQPLVDNKTSLEIKLQTPPVIQDDGTVVLTLGSEDNPYIKTYAPDGHLKALEIYGIQYDLSEYEYFELDGFAYYKQEISDNNYNMLEFAPDGSLSKYLIVNDMFCGENYSANGVLTSFAPVGENATSDISDMEYIGEGIYIIDGVKYRQWGAGHFEKVEE